MASFTYPTRVQDWNSTHTVPDYGGGCACSRENCNDCETYKRHMIDLDFD